MDKPDARSALEIYKRFAKQTHETIAFLDRARQLQNELHIAIPAPKHAPLSLAAALEEYLNDPGHRPIVESKSPAKAQTPVSVSVEAPPKSQPKELIDFFASLENEKTTVFFNPTGAITASPQQENVFNPFRSNLVPQATGFPAQNYASTPMQVVPQMTQSTSLSTAANTPNHSNPFRASIMPQPSLSTPTFSQTNTQYQGFQLQNHLPMPQATGFAPASSPTLPRSNSSHNPFAVQHNNVSTMPMTSSNPFAST
ncbi:hypothetical protein EC973_000671 [Apophysomyces ossiformis]|uniref:AP180 N-terminal homology (ANTH) domain-containing protein n=1 Tax=Apophysomyces ossiformis TaxID=679940 RepID=A0A8H7ESX6_9FUNG|nr:hypothetical protein EC973_000671 [Apophysomyces ossiformis]